MDLARNTDSSRRSSALLLTVIILASALWCLPPTGDYEPVAADVAQSADTGAVSALVTDNVGRPITGAAVSVVGLDVTDTTNSSGYALLENLPTDANWTQYLLFAEKTGYRASENVEVTVSPYNTTDATLEIVGGLLYCVVRDAIGPIPGANVSVLTLGYYNVTNADGVCTIGGVPVETTLAVAATATGYTPSQPINVVLDSDYFETVFFTMVSLMGAISGTVLHASTEEHLFNASVSVRVGTVTVSAFSDSDGEYRIDGVPSGTYVVTATLEGFDPSSVSDVVVQNGSDTTDVDILLVEKPTKLYGYVRSGAFLVPGVLISVVGTNLSTNSSIEGYYEIANITAGTYNVVASLEGYTTVTVLGVVIARGGQTQANINMTSIPGPSISGLVISSNSNSPLGGVTVVVIGFATQRNTVTNIDGQFVVTGLSGGNYTVRFFLDGYQPMELWPVEVPADGSAVLDHVVLDPVSEGFGGFIFGFDLAHSMMILALFLTIIMLALAVMLRIKAFEAPDKAPAVYDQEGEEAYADEKRPSERARDKDRQRKKKEKRSG
jgi:hypothetical protein